MKPPIQPGQTLQVIVPAGDRLMSLETQVSSYEGDAFGIQSPQLEGVKVLASNTELMVSVCTPDAVYSMTCKVLEVRSTEVLLGIPAAGAIRRVLQRQYVRAALSVDCSLEPWQHEGFAPPWSAQLCDLSGGGCAVLLESELRKETLVRVHLPLPEIGGVFAGRVRHCIARETPQGAGYRVGIEFELDELLRSRLIRFVCDQRARERKW